MSDIRATRPRDIRVIRPRLRLIHPGRPAQGLVLLGGLWLGLVLVGPAQAVQCSSEANCEQMCAAMQSDLQQQAGPGQQWRCVTGGGSVEVHEGPDVGSGGGTPTMSHTSVTCNCTSFMAGTDGADSDGGDRRPPVALLPGRPAEPPPGHVPGTPQSRCLEQAAGRKVACEADCADRRHNFEMSGVTPDQKREWEARLGAEKAQCDNACGARWGQEYLFCMRRHKDGPTEIIKAIGRIRKRG